MTINCGMASLAEQQRLALLSCVEIVLMRSGGPNYHLVQAKLDSLYNCTILDCYENPEYLQTVLKDVYKEKYDSIIANIKLELDELVNEEKIANFLKIMES